jgi:hypothetical protein
MRQVAGALRLPFDAMPVPDDLAALLADVRRRLAELDDERAELVRVRDETIVRARKAGGSLREVAEAVGMSHMAIVHIEERDKT